MMNRLICLLSTFLLLWAKAAAAQDAVPQPRQLPNIVLIAVDTVRSDHLGCYGYHRPTSPSIDKLAAQGVLFEQSYSVASWTLPAFMSILTGQLPAAHGCRGTMTALSPHFPTLPQRLQQKGYFCAAVVSNPYLSAKFGFGRGFDKYDDYTVFLDAELALLAADRTGDCKEVTELVTGPTVTLQAKRMIAAARKSGRPMFLFVHYFDPHDSYIPPPPYDRQFDPDYAGSITGRQLPAIRNTPPAPRDLQHLRSLHQGEVAFDDAQVGQLLTTLDATFDPANTLVILLSDHGEAFGEHGTLLHGASVYREEVCVPMIWRWSGLLPAGHRVTSPVAITDVAATLAKLLQLENFDPPHSRSLWAGLRGGQLPGHHDLLSDKCLGPGHHIALTRGKLRLHARFNTSPDQPDASYELYDTATDPGEQKKLSAADTPEFATMRASLLRLWTECLDLRRQAAVDRPGNQVQLDEKERRRIKGLGYTQSSTAK